ncbi:MAG TPA: peptidoglycan-binding protein [Pyrinomonadaceae bacterium]|nr:peptidoglycan-binding protein [Pyrinomonadaceae bacterium]
MPVLRKGSSGPNIITLQSTLKQLGFDPNGIDGMFGPGTEAAVIAFQKSKGLTPDGIVGPKTMAALQANTTVAGATVGTTTSGASMVTGTAVVAAPATAATVNVTVDQVTKMFPGVRRVNIEENLPFVMNALTAADLGDKDMVLMALATILVETGNFTPLNERQSKFNTPPGGPPFAKYDHRADLGNQGPPDGKNFRGRGYIQLTGRSNYKIHGAAIGLGNELVTTPTLANQPDIAAKLLASFLKSKEAKIRKALARNDLKTARKLVNGGSHGLPQFKTAFNIGRTVIT